MLTAPASRDPVTSAPSGSGDFDALFCERYEPLVRALSAGFGDREAAADAVQEAFVRAYARWWRVRRLEDPAGWVRRVAVNLLIDHTRRQTRGRRVLDRLARRDDHTAEAADEQLPGAGLALDRLDALAPQQRLAMALFYVEDLSVAEVATAMRISEGAVKYHLNRGRNALRAALVDEVDR